MGICCPCAHSAGASQCQHTLRALSCAHLAVPCACGTSEPRALCSVPVPGTLGTHWSRWAGTGTNRAGTVTNRASTQWQTGLAQWQTHLCRTGHTRDNLPGDGTRAQSWLSQAPGDQESPERSQGTATEASWQPDILKTSVDKVGISPWAGQCLHCVSPA